jgi:uncharacterized protein (TIGR00255 family)
MTGYGSGRAHAGAAVVVVDARAVNGRFLDVHVRLASPLTDHASVVDDAARRQLVRGRIEISGRLDGPPLGVAVLNQKRARAAIESLQGLRDALGSSEPIPLSLLSIVPGLFAEQADSDTPMIRDALQQAVILACEALMNMRRAEGRTLCEDLRRRTSRVAELGAIVAALAPALTQGYRERLRKRIADLLENTGTALDLGRLEHEVALLADRADVTEEATRLQSHCAQFLSLLDGAGDEPVGRKLEFLLQELNREVNTLGSKIADLQVTRYVLDLKAELERMREQVQNVV